MKTMLMLILLATACAQAATTNFNKMVSVTQGTDMPYTCWVMAGDVVGVQYVDGMYAIDDIKAVQTARPVSPDVAGTTAWGPPVITLMRLNWNAKKGDNNNYVNTTIPPGTSNTVFRWTVPHSGKLTFYGGGDRPTKYYRSSTTVRYHVTVETP